MTKLLAVFLAVSLSSLPAWSDEGHHHQLTEKEVGSVHFTTSCSKSVEANFNAAVALLHSFQYEQSREAFEGIGAQDQHCAMAYWGVAMTHYHGLWDNGDTDAGRKAWQQANETAVQNPATTKREKDYIAALGSVYVEDGKDKSAHAREFENRMAALQTENPNDDEAAVFHALSLAITAPKTDKTFSNQRRCGEILEPLFAKYPNHPGIAHYVIHCYDNPVLAAQGLNAARAYAKIAPASAHANHMPSHIFTRVGSWDESIASNLRSAELAAQAEKTSLNGEARDQRLHAMDYLEYAYLQSGRVKQAKAVLDEMASFSEVPGLSLTGDYGNAAIPARFAVELRRWDDAVTLRPRAESVPWAQAVTWMAVGIGGARVGNAARATDSERQLANLRDATNKLNNTYWANQIEVQRLEVKAWITQAAGNKDDAVATMRSAAELEESMDKHAVTPGAILPAREMLADLLQEQQRPKEALMEYESVLKVAPNRFNALYGAACAADSAGERTAATRYYQALLATATGDERSELVEARKKVVVTSQK